MICSACDGIFQSTPQELPITNGVQQKLFRHHEKPFMLESSANEGCQICLKLWGKLSEDDKRAIRETRKSSINIFKDRHVGYYGWCLSEERILQFHFGSLTWKTIEFALIPGNDPSFGRVEFHLDGSTQSLSVEDLMFQGEGKLSPDIYSMRSLGTELDGLPLIWSVLCSPQNPVHNFCHQYIGHAKCDTPKRLIDLAAPNCPTGVRLSLTPDEREALAYVTVSYHWGPNPELEKLVLLTKDTIGELSTAIDTTRLPKLFQDVIHVTRMLKFRYIWIDALCIIQGDEIDWVEQTSVMGEIYMNGYLNIAAGGAKSCHADLFSPHNPLLVAPCKIDLDPRWLLTSSRGNKMELDQPEPHYVVEMGFSQSNIMDTPLNRRAWVLQERQLSPRILHFGKDQLFWECRAMRACATFPLGLPSTRPFALTTGVHTLLTGMDAKVMKEQGIDLHRIWFEITELYSECGISRNTDRLPALSSLARYFGSAAFPGDTYLAGFWKEMIHYSLNWVVADGTQGNGLPCSRIRDSSLPSWSWASIHGKISLHSHDIQFWSHQRMATMEVIEAKITPADIINPHGHILDARLTVRGYLLPGDPVNYINFRREGGQLPVGGAQFAAFYGSVFKMAGLICIIDDLQDFLPFKRFNRISTRKDFQVPDIFFLPLLYVSDIDRVEGLMLKATSIVENKYRRIGRFNTSGSFNPKLFWDLDLTELILV